jgi:tetratricopeptide (TPR) repeat protein
MLAPGGSKKEAAAEPKRPPKPATCVAMGEYREQGSQDPGFGPADQARLREEARMAYQQAINLDPGYVPAYKALAHLYSSTGDHGRAVATYEQALKTKPKDPSLHFDYGMTLARHKEWPQAIEQFKAAHELDPDNRTLANTLAYALAMSRRFDESLAVFTQTVGQAQAYFNVAKAQYQLGEDALARQFATQALQLDPTHAPARDLLGELNGGTPAGTNPIATIGFETEAPAPGQ